MKWKQRELEFRAYVPVHHWLYKKYVDTNNLAHNHDPNFKYKFYYCIEDYQCTSLPERLGFVPIKDMDRSIIIAQYTGVKDVNGVKIFEGDIVRESPKTGRIDYIIVQYGISLFGAGFTFYKSRNYEILGNVFQNPELVEKYKLEI